MAAEGHDPTDTASADPTSGPSGPMPPRGEPATELGPGDSVGRYTLQALVGQGAMGRVFAAHDSQLGRTVALKLIHREHQTPVRRTRLLREAQALARLSHPNVVAVYDVGSAADDDFVAMELVRGTTLASWLAQAPQPWREVVKIFVEAGRGLEAAHAAGIIHRDFKPDNVILGDRVRVADFGLARAAGLDEPDAADATTPLELAMTRTGQRVGTPAYMAPEQLAGGIATAASDQYAYGVALYEALHGARPAEERERRPVPAWLQKIVDRALAPDPGDRYPTMRKLLADLSSDPGRTRRRWLAAATVAMLLAAGLWMRRGTVTEQCTGGGARLAGIWDAPRKDALRAAFAATHLPYSDDAWRLVRDTLDGYAARWIDMSREACLATRVEARQSDSLMDLRMTCLERRRAAFAALINVWMGGMDAEILEHASAAARGLPAIADCANTGALSERAPLPSDAAQAATIAAARAHIDVVNALTLAHRVSDASKAAGDLRAEADLTDWPLVQAEAALAVGHVLYIQNEIGAEPHLVDAARLAGAAHDDLLAARALVELVDHLARNAQNPEGALLMANVADSWIARAGGDAALLARLLRHRGAALQAAGKFLAARAVFILARAFSTEVFGAGDVETLQLTTMLASVIRDLGDFAEARRLDEENLPATIRLLGPGHPLVVNTLIGLGNTALDEGNFDAAASYFRRSLAIVEKIAGPDSAKTATSLSNLGAADLVRGDLAEARTLLERALAIRERTLGPDHPYVALTIENLAIIESKQGHPELALSRMERALAILTTAYGPAHDAVAVLLDDIGEVLEAQGDFAAAVDRYRRALDIRLKVHGPENAKTLHSMTDVARELMLLHRCTEARRLLGTATSGLEKVVSPRHPYVAGALEASAGCDVAEGQPAQAVERLERAIAIEEKLPSPISRGSARWLLARALWSLGRRDAAVAAARQAEHDLAADAEGARDRAAVQVWLAAHTR